MYLLNKERYVAGSSNSKSLINSHSLLVAKDPYRESSNVSHLYLSRRNSAISFLVSSPLNAEDFGNSRSLIPDSRKSPRFLLAWPRKFFTAVLLSTEITEGLRSEGKVRPGCVFPSSVLGIPSPRAMELDHVARETRAHAVTAGNALPLASSSSVVARSPPPPPSLRPNCTLTPTSRRRRCGTD